MKVLITGGAGFIGSHLCEYLNKKKEIKKIIIIDHLEDGTKKNLKNILSSKKVKFYKCDIRNYNSILPKFKNIDCVVHLAALSDIVPSITDPKNYMVTNINGTMNVLESMKENKVKKIVYAASSSCYGIPKKYPTNETEKINPKYPYSFSKNIGEQTIQHWSNVFKINFVSLRLFNVYGTRSRTHGAYGAALGVFLKQKLSKKPFTVVGDGNQKRDFVNVLDVARAFYLSIKTKKKNKIFNVGYGNPQSINKLLSYLGGKKIFIPKRPGEPDITHANISLIKKELKWRPEITLKKGIETVLKEINYWSKAPLWTPKKIEKTTKVWFKYLKNEK
jgi:UDP-glucose 4-epimerase